MGLRPEPGYYKTRLARGAPWVPARIWWAPATDPDTGERLDRPAWLRCMIAGEDHDPIEVWPLHPISEAEYRQMVAAMPDDPRRPADLGAQAPLF